MGRREELRSPLREEPVATLALRGGMRAAETGGRTTRLEDGEHDPARTGIIVCRHGR